MPKAYDDPIEAWHRLGPDWQRAVCHWRGWPASWASGTDDGLAAALHRLGFALDDAGVPPNSRPGLGAVVERLQHLVEQRDALRLWLEEYGRHAERCTAGMCEECHRRCGWAQVNEHLQTGNLLPLMADTIGGHGPAGDHPRVLD
ncbi:hypothetical protein [Halomonas sp.]|uniref:hypothetical protein n=1 Tax=Halomonas sp. TaxID=1486246 RepID=UPI00356A3066